MSQCESFNLQVGMDVFVRGHLSQRLSSTGPMTEVTALTITPVTWQANTTKCPSANVENSNEQMSQTEPTV